MDIDIRDPRLNDLIDPAQELTCIAGGFEFVEGPAWHPGENSLVFSDILGNSIYRWKAEKGLETLRRNSYMANGNTYDLDGRLVTCEHATSRVTRTDFSNNGELEVLAGHYQGMQLNSPNDIVCKSNGDLYFTDPNSGRSAGYGVPRRQELDFQGVYRLDTADLNLTLLVKDFSKPNGLCFSPDEKRLFINDSDHNHIRVFEVADHGALSGGQVWMQLTPDGIGVADGMKIDRAGNLFCAGPGGIHIIDPGRTHLGVIHTPEFSANLAWGDPDLKSLYITASTSIYRLRVKSGG